MSNLVSQLLEEQKHLEKIRGIISERLKGAPPGKLRSSTCHGQPQYYYCLEKKDRNGQYIPISQTDLIGQLAQKEYDKNILSSIDSRLQQIQKLQKIYDVTDFREYYDNMTPAKQKWITPVEPIWEDYLKQWIETPYTGKAFAPNDRVIYSNRKQPMRSKSEASLANYFDSRGILYKYECPLKLSPYGTIYPDFTFLSPYTFQEIYLEHLGIMDDANYSSNAVSKIKLYERNHIFPGERLFLTFETDKNKLDLNIVEEMVNKYLVLPEHKK